MFRIAILTVCLLGCMSAQAQQKYLAYPYNKPAPSQDDTPYTPTPTQATLFPNASATIGVPMPKAPTPQAPTPQAPTPNAPNPKSAYDQPPIKNSGANVQPQAVAPDPAQAPAVSVTVRPPDPAQQAQQDQELQAIKDKMFQKPNTQ